MTVRSELRRQQVLDAAIQCFRQRGFHATSMVMIAAACGISVGNIYRYFASKEAIIEAIVRQDVDRAAQEGAKLEATATNLHSTLIDRTDQGVQAASDPDRGALMIEIRAEAARNPKVAAIVQAADKEMRFNLRTLFSGAMAAHLSETEIDARIEMLAAVFAGIPIRVISNPDFNQDALLDMARLVVDAILSHGAD